jgi:hypothetical protein
VAVAIDDTASTLQLDQEDAGLGDDQRVDLVYGAVVGDEFEVRVDEIRVPILENIAQEIKRLALVREPRFGELFPALSRQRHREFDSHSAWR